MTVPFVAVYSREIRHSHKDLYANAHGNVLLCLFVVAKRGNNPNVPNR